MKNRYRSLRQTYVRLKDRRVFWEKLPIQRKTNLIRRPWEVQLNVEHQLPVLLKDSLSDESAQTSENTFLFYSTTHTNNETFLFNSDRACEINVRLAHQRLNLHCMKAATIQLKVVNRFSIRLQALGMRVEPFILMINTNCASTIPITIVNTNFKPSHFVSNACAIKSQINDVQLKSDETVTEGFV